MHVAQKFERLLDAHRRPDGSRWTGQQLDDATGGVVTRSYFTNLRKGRIENPGYQKMRAIAKAIGFPPEEWFEENVGGAPSAPAYEESGLAGRVEHLFDAVRNPKTGGQYTNAEVARMTLGDLSEEDVEGIRTGAIADPTVHEVAALAGVFGVEPSYLLDQKEPPLLDEEIVEALASDFPRLRGRRILGMRKIAPLLVTVAVSMTVAIAGCASTPDKDVAKKNVIEKGKTVEINEKPKTVMVNKA